MTTKGGSAARPLPIVSPEQPLSELLREAGVHLASDGIRESLANLSRHRNREQATAVLLERLARQGGRLELTRLARPAFERRLTLAARAIEAAGVHPDEELRGALGACAAHLVLAGEPDELPGVMAIDLLARLSALDYALLDVAVSASVSVYDKPAPRQVVGDPAPGQEGQPSPRQLPASVRPLEDLRRVLTAHFPGLGPEQVRQASHRLRRLGLFFPEHVYGQPSALGSAVLQLSKGP